MPTAAHSERIRGEQVAALFGSLRLGVLSAAAGAMLLVVSFHLMGILAGTQGFAWSLFILACAICHMLLERARRRDPDAAGNWRFWAAWFTVIALAEGIGWGWGSVGLTAGLGIEIQLLVLVVCFGVATGAVPAFSSFLPAFFALFLPVTLPFALLNIGVDEPVQRIGSLMMLVFIGGIGALAVKANQSFNQMVGLRLETEELAEDLRRQKEIAEEANRAKSRFLAAASHDLRQPVHALGLFVGALRSVSMPGEGTRLLDQIETSTIALDGLFSALLDISRLDAGTVEVHRRSFEIDPILAPIIDSHADEALAKGVSLVLRPCGAVVDSDPMLLERIVRNLVTNAIRYTDHGRIVVGCRRRGAMLAIQVWDTGRGIPAAEHDRIFQEYYQLGNPERDRAKGLGLGLAIVRRLTDLLQCRLELCSQPGRGSRFEIVIPVAVHPSAPIGSVADAVSAGSQTGLIVVIDDEIPIREAMRSLLTAWGYEVLTAASGQEAVDRLVVRPDRPALIICDYRLRDGANGIDVIEDVRSEYNETIPAMLITGDTAPDRLAEARASGLVLLHKPVSNSKLRAAIGNLLANARHSATTDEITG